MIRVRLWWWLSSPSLAFVVTIVNYIYQPMAWHRALTYINIRSFEVVARHLLWRIRVLSAPLQRTYMDKGLVLLFFELEKVMFAQSEAVRWRLVISCTSPLKRAIYDVHTMYMIKMVWI